MNDKDDFTVETDVDLGLIASEQRIVELDKVRFFWVRFIKSGATGVDPGFYMSDLPQLN